MSKATSRQAQLVVPATIQRRAGIRAGDPVEFKAARGVITIIAKDPAGKRRTYTPTKAEIAAMAAGRAEIKNGEYVSLAQLIDELARTNRQTRSKSPAKVSG
jgi:bifunctional DNA-binding transcriptional regulator/antitoxin component of YhaV-PrlF toxin-antitoxin module